jgi:hypothetical protein
MWINLLISYLTSDKYTIIIKNKNNQILHNDEMLNFFYNLECKAYKALVTKKTKTLHISYTITLLFMV